MTQPHHLRFARALALAALVPGCATTTPPPASQMVAQADAHVVATSDAAAPSTEPDAASDVDAGLPFSSGPIVPPELPESFA